MTLVVNGERRKLEAGITVSELVSTLGRESRGIAVAVNEELVPRRDWPVTKLREHDRVEVLTAAAGG